MAGAPPGRSCPLHYRYGAHSLSRRDGDLVTDTLYVAGGLYGNRCALDALERLIAHDTGARVLFNGDFHWFDIAPDNFAEIQQRVLAHLAIAGNVEAELADGDSEAGCGCAYPDNVANAVVERSNLIHARLSHTANLNPHWRGELVALDYWRCARIGDARIGVVHGDAHALAGWSFDASALRDPARRPAHEAAFAAAQCDVFASSHTCLAALARFGERYAIINNGTAGMPCFRGRLHGVVTRIALTPPPADTLYGLRIGALHIDALPLHYDHTAWLGEFSTQWPAGSPAALNYLDRIINGPSWTLADAMP